ncbi:hypothetical protein Esti_004133 [Eimeria stiedai]
MASFWLFTFLIVALFAALHISPDAFVASLRLENEAPLEANASSVEGKATETPGPSAPSAPASGPQSRRSRLRGLTLPIQRALANFRRVLTRRTAQQAEQDYQTLEAAAMKHLACFSLSDAALMASRSVVGVCGNLDTEALLRSCSMFAWIIAQALARVDDCLKQENVVSSFQKLQCVRTNRLFLVHPLLHEGLKEPSKLRFQGGVPNESAVEGEDALTGAFRRLSSSVMGSVDSHHVLAGKLLIRSTLARQGFRQRLSNLWARLRGRPTYRSSRRIPEADKFVDEARRLYESMPPHPDPLAIRLTTAMMLDRLSCPKDSSFETHETVLVEGKPKRVKVQELLEATILLVTEALFDARDCASDESKADDPTCRLLSDYDQFRMNSQNASQRETAENSTDTQGGDPDLSSPEEGQAVTQGEVESAAEEKTNGNEVAVLTGGERDALKPDQQSFSEVSGSSEDQMSDPSAYTSNDQQYLKKLRITDYAVKAASSAVAYARLSLRTNTKMLRVVKYLLKNKILVQSSVTLLQDYMGRDIFSMNGLTLHAFSEKRGELILTVYVRTLIDLLTGNPSLAQVSATIAKLVVKESLFALTLIFPPFMLIIAIVYTILLTLINTFRIYNIFRGGSEDTSDWPVTEEQLQRFRDDLKPPTPR